MIFFFFGGGKGVGGDNVRFLLIYSSFSRVEKKLVSEPKKILRRDRQARVQFLCQKTRQQCFSWKSFGNHIHCKGVNIRKELPELQLKILFF